MQRVPDDADQTHKDTDAERGQVFADPVAPTAIVDRLLHCATVLNIKKGRSYRMRAHQEPFEAQNGR